MYAYSTRTTRQSSARKTQPSDELSVAVTFPPERGGAGLTKFEAPLSAASVGLFKPEARQMDQGIHELGKLGFRLTRRGHMSASMRVSRKDYEKVFGTKLTAMHLDPKLGYQANSFYFPADGAKWQPSEGVTSLIDDAYIQWPHIYMAKRAPAKKRKHRIKPAGDRITRGILPDVADGGTTPSATPPQVDYFHLEVPGDVATLINARKVHQAGINGSGVRVVMVDSGFAHTSHPFFAAHGFTSTVDLAPGASNDSTDIEGHGSGESTNIFSVAPGATFIGVKVDNDDPHQQGASMLEGFQTAMQHDPHIISISMGYDLRTVAGKQMSLLPNSLAALEAEIQAAVAAGVIVVFSAGNGHFSFPGMMPEVISAGGVFVDQDGQMQASDYASAFQSKIYAGRNVPDFCGLVGMQPSASYIMLPIPSGCKIDSEMSDAGDGTTTDDGWGAFSGTSAAAPQLAGVCALLKQKSPSITPQQVKALLRSTARDVLTGHSNPTSSDDGEPMQAGAGDDGSTGAGLVDAFAAFQQL